MSMMAQPRQSFVRLSTLYEDALFACFPVLKHTCHKGSSGRILTIGGSLNYTGAPFFSAIAALRSGADLSTILCCSPAGVPIKSYSPNVMVSPNLDDSSFVTSPDGLSSLLSRMHCVVLGPGLGRELSVASDQRVESGLELGQVDHFSRLFDKVLEARLPVVIDADGLWYLTHLHSGLASRLTGRRVVLTPNVNELRILADAFECKRDETDADIAAQDAVRDLAHKTGATILLKGKQVAQSLFSEDIIATSERMTIVEWPSSHRRCGGQGDLLSGTLGALLRTYYVTSGFHNTSDRNHEESQLLACVVACAIAKQANLETFQKYGRSMVTSDMLEFFHSAVAHVEDSLRTRTTSGL